MAKQTVTIKERYRMIQIMQDSSEVVSSANGRERRRWLDGKTFEAIASECGGGVSAHHLRYAAKEMGWDFEDRRPALSAANMEVITNRLDAVERDARNEHRNAEAIQGVIKRIDDIEKNVLEVMQKCDQAAALGDRALHDLAKRVTQVENDQARRVMYEASQRSSSEQGKPSFKTWIVFSREGDVTKPAAEFIKWFAYRVAAKDQIHSFNDLRRFIAAQKLNRTEHGQKLAQAELAWGEYNKQTNGE